MLCAGVALSMLRGITMNLPEAVIEADVAELAERVGLTDTILSEMTPEAKEYYGITRQSLERFMASDSVNKAASDVLKRYVDAASVGDFTHHITLDEITDLLRANEHVIWQEFGYRLTAQDYAEITRYFSYEVSLEDYSVYAAAGETGIPDWLPKFALSLIPPVAAFLLCALLFFNLFVANIKWLRRAALYIGVVFFTSGLLFLLAWLLLDPVIGSASVSQMLSSPPLNVKQSLLGASVTLYILGVIAILTYCVILFIRKRRMAVIQYRPYRNLSKSLKIAAISANSVVGLLSGLLLFFAVIL
jgi:hypothetical protein